MKDDSVHWNGEAIRQFLLDLESQESLYARMLEQTRAQLPDLERIETAEQLGAILLEKQALMQSLEDVERRLAPRKAAWPDERARLPEEIVEFTDCRMGLLQETLRQLIAAEDEAGLMIGKRLALGRKKLGEISRKGMAARAYAPGGRGSAYYLDDRS